MAEDLTKLPKWAQSRIRVLEMNLEHAKEKLAAGPENSNTFADRFYQEGARPLGQDTKITFMMDGHQDDNRHHSLYIEGRVERDPRGSFLYIMGGDSIHVEPQSSNTVKIRLHER
jgi:hypothetical protein